MVEHQKMILMLFVFSIAVKMDLHTVGGKNAQVETYDPSEVDRLREAVKSPSLYSINFFESNFKQQVSFGISEAELISSYLKLHLRTLCYDDLPIHLL